MLQMTVPYGKDKTCIFSDIIYSITDSALTGDGAHAKMADTQRVHAMAITVPHLSPTNL